MKVAPLRYQGLAYRGYYVRDDKTLFRRLKSKDSSGRPKFKAIKLHSRPDGYDEWYVANTVKGRPRKRILAHRAVAESFTDPTLDLTGLVAAHVHGTRRCDGKAGDCVFRTVKENRHDRKRDGTHSTGNRMKPGKLTGMHWRVLQLYRRTESQTATARMFGCTPQAIRRVLRMYAII